MKTSTLRLPVALVALASVPLGLALLLHAPSSRADLSPSPPPSPPRDPAAAATAAATPSASASPSSATAATAVTAATRSGPPVLSDNPPGEEKSKAPTADEWKGASALSFDRPLRDGCTPKQVREWVRVTCALPGSQVRVVAGPLEGFSASIAPIRQDGSEVKGSYYVQFPVRRGESRVYEISTVVTGGYDDQLFPQVDYLLVSSWVQGEAPVLLTQTPSR